MNSPGSQQDWWSKGRCLCAWISSSICYIRNNCVFVSLGGLTPSSIRHFVDLAAVLAARQREQPFSYSPKCLYLQTLVCFICSIIYPPWWQLGSTLVPSSQDLNYTLLLAWAPFSALPLTSNHPLFRWRLGLKPLDSHVIAQKFFLHSWS